MGKFRWFTPSEARRRKLERLKVEEKIREQHKKYLEEREARQKASLNQTTE